MIDRWQLLPQETKIRVIYNVLKTLLGLFAIVVTSEYVSQAFTNGITGSWIMYYGEAASLFVLGSVTLREGARSLIALNQVTEVFPVQVIQPLEADPLV